MKCTSPLIVLALGLILVILVSQCYGHLQVNYYKGKCQDHDVEKIIHGVITKRYKNNTRIVSNLVRIPYHDCLVRGCDASILLDGPATEKKSRPNTSIGDFDVLDDAKEAVENVCPGVVSCADVINIAARSVVALAGGKWYDVETGRRDGLISNVAEATALLPNSTQTVDAAIKEFESMNLTTKDLVVLLGSHTVGSAHCENFEDRIYNFKNTSKPDKRLSPSFLRLLKRTCPTYTKLDNTTYLDQTPNSHFKMDNGYYKQILRNKAVIESDANLVTSKKTIKFVKKLASNNHYFLNAFGRAMVKMGRYGVLTGNKGEIRKSCRSVNS